MSGPKRTIKPLPRKRRITPEIIETFRRASELWDVAHDDDDSPERDEWIAISKRLNWTLLGLGPQCCLIEVPVGLDRRDVALVVVHVAVRRLRAGTITSHI
jgi:hypothetical protein